MGNNTNPYYVFLKGNTYYLNRHLPRDFIENDGFTIPNTVEQSTAQWFEDSDSILYWFKGNYLHDLLDARKNKKVGITDAYSKFKTHMEEIGDGQYVPTRN